MTFTIKNLESAFPNAVTAMPPLPSVIQYEDDYDEISRSLKTAECEHEATIFVSGTSMVFRFDALDISVRQIIRHFVLSNLLEMAPASALYYYRLVSVVDSDDIGRLAYSLPLDVRAMWPDLASRYSSQTIAALKSFLAFLCRLAFANWSPLYTHFVSFALPANRSDPYASVRSGDCFLSLNQEAQLVRWIEFSAHRHSELTKREAEIACLVVCSYQFGMRPKQLGMIRTRDCSIRTSAEDGSAIVHLNFKMIKQRDDSLSKLPLIRKVKREWAPLFSSLMQHKATDSIDSYFLGFSSRIELSTALIKQLDEIVPGAGLTAYDLRHTLAQRLVDSGASQEELASALGHSALRTGLVYFRASANQAELVNKALGASAIYQAVVKIAHAKFIDPEELAALRGDLQIAGAPHGIPIAGIGGCSSGQPACPYNPVTACYGCPKFMPVRDLSLHEQVLREFRNVVLFFKEGGHGDMTSPAYLQLQRTIAEVQSVIQELQD